MRVADSFGPRDSTTDMLGNDMFSFDDDNPFGGEDDLERLSEFDEVRSAYPLVWLHPVHDVIG